MIFASSNIANISADECCAFDKVLSDSRNVFCMYDVKST